jgi:putative DNA primase/helicase
VIAWKEWQICPISEELYKKWKTEGLFHNGCAIITGILWRGFHKNKYLVCIDIDNKTGIAEFLSYFPESKTLEGLGQKTIVEQHDDNLDRTHIYFITEIPIAKINNINFVLSSSTHIPKIEVKSDQQTIVICSPSIHKNGKPYKIIGTNEPAILNEEQSKALEYTLNNSFEKYDKRNTHPFIKKYHSEYKQNSLPENLRKIIKNLKIDEYTAQNCKIYEGFRHATLLFFANSMLFEHFDNDELKKNDYWKLKDFLYKVNNMLCLSSPIPKGEIETIWNDARDYVIIS